MSFNSNKANNLSNSNINNYSNTNDNVSFRQEQTSRHSRLWEIHQSIVDSIDGYLYELDDAQFAESVFKKINEIEQLAFTVSDSLSLMPYLAYNRIMRAVYAGSHHSDASYQHARLRFARNVDDIWTSHVAKKREFSASYRNNVDSMSFRTRTHYGDGDALLKLYAQHENETQNVVLKLELMIMRWFNSLGFNSVKGQFYSDPRFDKIKASSITGLPEVLEVLTALYETTRNCERELASDNYTGFILSRLVDDSERVSERVDELRGHGRDALGTSTQAHLVKIESRYSAYVQCMRYCKVLAQVTIAIIFDRLEQCYTEATDYTRDILDNRNVDEGWNFRIYTLLCWQEFKRKLSAKYSNITFLEDFSDETGRDC